jgi:hypothetical protein
MVYNVTRCGMTQNPKQKTKQRPMKIIPLLALLIAAGCILASGCVAQTKKDTVNGTTTPTSTFAPFTNTTTVPNSNMTNVTNATNVTKLKGPLRVSISGYPADLPLIIDNVTVGIVSREKPLDLMIDEGVHNVTVCVGKICEQENVTIFFAKKTYVDFGERLRRDVEFPEPTARIVEYFKYGDGIAVNIEFINPLTKDLAMSAEVSCGYSYIDDRTNIKMGDSVRGKVSEWVAAGDRLTTRVELYFASGHSYSYDPPTIIDMTFK